MIRSCLDALKNNSKNNFDELIKLIKIKIKYNIIISLLIY